MPTTQPSRTPVHDGPPRRSFWLRAVAVAVAVATEAVVVLPAPGAQAWNYREVTEGAGGSSTCSSGGKTYYNGDRRVVDDGTWIDTYECVSGSWRLITSVMK
jgi:hypothetical protein